MKIRTCENRFCVYWEGSNCVLDSVSLDELGLCSDCVYVVIEEDILQKKREVLR